MHIAVSGLSQSHGSSEIRERLSIPSRPWRIFPPTAALVTPRCWRPRSSVPATAGDLHPAAHPEQGSRVGSSFSRHFCSFRAKLNPPPVSRITTPRRGPLMRASGSQPWCWGRGDLSQVQKDWCGSPGAARLGPILNALLTQAVKTASGECRRGCATEKPTWAPRRLDQRGAVSWPSSRGQARRLSNSSPWDQNRWRWWTASGWPACCFSICSRRLQGPVWLNRTVSARKALAGRFPGGCR